MSLCATCQTPLTLTLDIPASPSSSPSTTTIPDDVHLPCTHHLHWTCLLSAPDHTTCPACAHPLQNPHHQILVDLHNEGGLQRQIDIAPLLHEEAYLRAHPEERKCRAFIEFCREGDHRAVAELLKSCSEEGEEEDEDEDEEGGGGPQKPADEILRYQDPLNDMQSGLHAAAANGHREVAWLLLLLASSYPELEMPALVFQEAAALGVMREDGVEAKVDIRGLRDARGRTAEDVAREVGGVWHGWIGNGRLAVSGG
ncbi:Ring finger [Teratosphaeria destructans]|uniref:Ring finger n=1 Tax=Teratosphaeria destructans TaxID=418781 RepID=A0A9W7T1M2_9PEZI|nr:Ring finger [Teratosphaeria destructans]